MLSVSENYLQAVNSDSRDMPYRVTLSGGIVLDKSKVPNMLINESVSDTEGLSLGTANSTTLTLTLKDADTINYNGMLVEPESGLVLTDGSTEWVPLGKFWVTDFSTRNDYKTVTLSCADGMYHMMGKYTSKLTYPAHVRDVTHEIVSQTGVEFEEPTEWPEVYVRRKPEDLTHREAIGHVAGCCGCNARFNRSGKLEFAWYSDSGVVVGRELQYLDGMTKLNPNPLEVKFEIEGQVETYEVNVISDGNGGITATPGQNVLEDETVILSVNPFSGYELATIHAETEHGDVVTLYQRAEGGYTFVQPDSNVTVTASFRQVNATSFKLTVRAYDGGSIRASGEIFDEGSSPTIYVKANEGYELDGFATTPATISLSRLGTNADGETLYEFTMPQSDVTINAYFKEETVYYALLGTPGPGGGFYFSDVSTGEYIDQATEGTVVSITATPYSGYAFDSLNSDDVTFTQINSNVYTFVMPSSDVNIYLTFALSEDETKTDLYSWMQTPQPAPTEKPYWAVLYNESETLPTCQKYYLIWFDNWEATGRSDGEYSVRFDGYYYCGGKNNGHGWHEWDTSSWYGNGASGSSLEWDVVVGSMVADWDAYYGPSTQYCLLASNVHLYYNGDVVMEKCETAIQEPQVSYVQDGVDIREKSSLSQWKCPDTFSTPSPASNWMILMPDSGLYMTIGEDGKYDTPISSYPKSLIAFFYDDISIQNLGAIFTDTFEEFYLASFTNARWTYLRSSTSDWDEEIHELPEGAVIGLRSPLVTTLSTDGYLDGSNYNFAGVLATSQTLYDGNGNLFMYNNSCRICDCVSVVEEPTTFLLRRTVSDAVVIEAEDITVTTDDDTIFILSDLMSVSTNGDAIVVAVGSLPTNVDSVTMIYTNPMIYEKMVAPISECVQGFTYTPATVKCRGNPALQAGDIVTVPDKNGTYHTVLIMQQTMRFGGGMNAEISCPGKTEEVKTFSAISPLTTQIKREVQLSNTELEKRLSSNNALVFNSMYSEIGRTESKIKSVVEWQTETDSTIAKIEQTADENSGKIALVVGQNGLVNEDGTVQGSVVIEAINGESTAKINADRIELEGKKLDIKVDATNIEGKVTAEQIDANGITAQDGTFSGEFSTQHIYLQDRTLTVVSDGGGDITIIPVSWSVQMRTGVPSYPVATATIAEPAPADLPIKCRLQFTNSGITAYEEKTGYIYQGQTSGTVSFTTNLDYNLKKYIGVEWVAYSSTGTVVVLDSSFAPSVDSAFSIGTASRKWADIYSLSSAINTSDEREKHSISEIPQKYSDMFYKLNPIIYKLNEGTSDRFHVGFGAQSVEKAMTECGITDKEFAGLIKSPQADGDSIYGLRYSEFIALAVLEIQKLNEKIFELEKKINGQ